MFFLLLLILPVVRTQDTTSQSYLQQHRLPFNAVQFLQHKQQVKKGPILFPNDAPPPPPTPLIVTSRPLSESIARSELNPNNSVTAQSEYYQVTFKPELLARGKSYQPYSYTLATVTPAVGPTYDAAEYDATDISNEKFIDDYEQLLEFIHPRKPRREKRSAHHNLLSRSERRRFNQRRLMEFITPKKPDSKAGEVLVQTLQQRTFDQPIKLPIVVEEKERKPQNKIFQHPRPPYTGSTNSTTKYLEYEYDFNEEDNNFDFDFKKLYTATKHLGSNSSEYLEHYTDTQKVRRRLFERFSNDEDFPMKHYKNLITEANNKAWFRVFDHEKQIYSVEESDDIANILGLSKTSQSIMRNVKNIGNVRSIKMKTHDRIDRSHTNILRNYGRREKLQPRAVKPLNEFGNSLRHQSTALRADQYKYKPRAVKPLNEFDNSQSHQSTALRADQYKYKPRAVKPLNEFGNSQRHQSTALRTDQYKYKPRAVKPQYEFVNSQSHQSTPLRADQYKYKPRAVKPLNEFDNSQRHQSTALRADQYKYKPRAVKPLNEFGNSQRHQSTALRANQYKNKPRAVKPLNEFDNSQSHQSTALRADQYKYKNSPNQHYHLKNKGREHDFNQATHPNDNYAFSYAVKDHKTGDDFSHSQKSTGTATNGEYRVLLPDGRMQIVSYTADENGYKADVRYDNHHNQDNSIDFDYDKSFDNYDRPIVKQNYDHNQDYSKNEDFVHHQPRPFKTNLPSYEQRHVENINDYGNKKDNKYQYYNVYPTKAAFVKTTANIDDPTLDGLSDNNNDYLEQYNKHLESNDKVVRADDDYKFSDLLDFTKEVVDYSSELDHPYEPHKSKYSLFVNNEKQQAQGQVRPSYDELKPLFVTNANGRRNAAIPVSTVRPVYAVTPTDVVAITPKKPIHNLYTNIKSIVTPAPYIFSTPSPSTPRSYLLSTIANLKHQISLANKPVLSEQYINKINKYLSYSNPVKVNK